MVTVLCNVATLLAIENTLLVKGITVEHTPAQIASYVNSVCPDKVNFIMYCTGSNEPKSTNIIKSSQNILDYILADNETRKVLITNGNITIVNLKSSKLKKRKVPIGVLNRGEQTAAKFKL